MSHNQAIADIMGKVTPLYLPVRISVNNVRYCHTFITLIMYLNYWFVAMLRKSFEISFFLAMPKTGGRQSAGLVVCLNMSVTFDQRPWPPSLQLYKPLRSNDLEFSLISKYRVDNYDMDTLYWHCGCAFDSPRYISKFGWYLKDQTF